MSDEKIKMEETFNEEHNETGNKKKNILYIVVGVVSLFLVIFVLIPKNESNQNAVKNVSQDTLNSNKERLNRLVFQKEEEREISGSDKIDFSKFEKNFTAEDEQDGSVKSQLNSSNIPPVVSPSQNRSSNMNFNTNIGGMSKPIIEEYKFKYSNLMKKRLDPEFQAMVEHLTSNRSRGSWELSKSEYNKYKNKKDLFSKVEEPLKDLYVGANNINNNSSVSIGSGTRIRAITENQISSKHPGIFTAKIIRPFELKGATLMCKSGPNVNNRIPCSIDKLITRNGEEVNISGQIDMNGIVGLEGRVHWQGYKRMLPAITNAGIGGALMAWQMQNEVDSVRVDSRDAVYSPIIQSSVQELQSEITNLGGDYPDVVKIKKGSNFTVLLTSPFKVKI